MKYKKIVIGVDQSYTRTGLSIGADGELKKVTSIDYKGLKRKTDKRNELRKTLRKVIELNKDKADEIVILCERISTFRKSFGNKKNQQGSNPAYLKMTGALVASMVDTASEYGIKVYSVDTRSWKSRIVGTSKGDKDGNKKGPTIRFVEKLGFDLIIRYKKSGKNKGEPIYDDDAADSACICLYGFLPEKEQKLLEEE